MITAADIHRLEPSAAPPIPLEVLRELPLGGIYVWKRAGSEDSLTLKIVGWDGEDLLYRWPTLEGWSAPEHRCRADLYQLFYPRLLGLSFLETPKAFASGAKTVTRRKPTERLFKIFKPGALFMGWDRSRRAGRGKARGLGVREVVSAGRVGRWACKACRHPLPDRNSRHRHEPNVIARHYRFFPAVDTLTPAELAREGFPDMEPDECWALLENIGAVVDGHVARIEFKEI